MFLVTDEARMWGSSGRKHSGQLGGLQNTSFPSVRPLRLLLGALTLTFQGGRSLQRVSSKQEKDGLRVSGPSRQCGKPGWGVGGASGRGAGLPGAGGVCLSPFVCSDLSAQASRSGPRSVWVGLSGSDCDPRGHVFVWVSRPACAPVSGCLGPPVGVCPLHLICVCRPDPSAGPWRGAASKGQPHVCLRLTVWTCSPW